MGSPLVEVSGTGRLNLTMAVTDCDHLRDVVSGVVRPDGILLTPIVLPVEEIFYRLIKNHEWHVSEMSFAKYLALMAAGAAQMVAIPVFPSRVFRHSAIYVRTDRGIAKPKDLEGKRIGIPEWAQTAGIYVRGFLEEQYGVDLRSISWVQAGVNQPGREEKVALNLEGLFNVTSRPDTSLDRMLRSGEIDAAISAREPDAFVKRDPHVARMFPKFREEEAVGYQATGVFPIMHVVVLRRDIYDAYPWIAMNLFKAFEQAKDRSIARMRDITATGIPLPWSAAITDEITEIFGGDLWPYGLAPNRRTLDAFCRYGFNQRATNRLVQAEELFAKETLASYKV